jgi:hypothetical protein
MKNKKSCALAHRAKIAKSCALATNSKKSLPGELSKRTATGILSGALLAFSGTALAPFYFWAQDLFRCL